MGEIWELELCCKRIKLAVELLIFMLLFQKQTQRLNKNVSIVHLQQSASAV